MSFSPDDRDGVGCKMLVPLALVCLGYYHWAPLIPPTGVGMLLSAVAAQRLPWSSNICSPCLPGLSDLEAHAVIGEGAGLSASLATKSGLVWFGLVWWYYYHWVHCRAGLGASVEHTNKLDRRPQKAKTQYKRLPGEKKRGWLKRREGAC